MMITLSIAGAPESSAALSNALIESIFKAAPTDRTPSKTLRSGGPDQPAMRSNSYPSCGSNDATTHTVGTLEDHSEVL